MKQAIYSETITNGILHIAAQQRKDGSFISLSSPQADFSVDTQEHHTTFFTSQILALLPDPKNAPDIPSEIRNALVTVRRRAENFLLKEKSTSWSFNYWSRKNPEALQLPYPDDLDDTFAALIALHLCDPKRIDSKVLARIVRLLTTLEAREGGPYRTWLVSSDSAIEWQDIDLVVNSTISRFLSFYDIQLPNIKELVEMAIRAKDMRSPYYPGLCQVAYFVSQVPGLESKDKFARMILGARSANGSWNTPLDTAMAVLAIAHLGFQKQVSLNMLDQLVASCQRKDWQAFPFCIDPARGGKENYAGSSALTAAFVISALRMYSTAAVPSVSFKADKRRSDADIATHSRVQALALRQARSLPKELREAVSRVIAHTTDAQITSLAYRFREALGTKGKKIGLAVTDRLALANLYGWMAYTIYDDFMDDEGEPLFLPVANYFLRELTTIYLGSDVLGKPKVDPKANVFFRNILNTIDAANLWEREYCQLSIIKGTLVAPTRLAYSSDQDLYRRSIGHALGPCFLLHSLGFDFDSKKMKALLDFFRHYLIARQIHDDAHDWADDLRRGRLNYVGAILLRSWRRSAGERNIRLSADMPALQKLFWEKAISQVVRRILYHTEKAREGIAILHAEVDKAFFEDMLAGLERGAHQALEESRTTKDFLKEYGDPVSG